MLKRRSFSRIGRVLEFPNLIETQLTSFEGLIQSDVNPEKRERKGLEEVFRSIFPITNYKKTATLEYLGSELGTWHCKCGEYKGLGGPGVVCEKCKKEITYKQKYSLVECRQRGVSYSDPMKIIVRLILREEDEQTGEMEVREIKEQKIYLGELPLMTPYGTFIINGTERVIVNQLHRSPGVVFIKEKGKGVQLGRTIFTSRIIPHRGSWLDFEFDTKEICHVRIDRRKKFPATILLKALGYGVNELIKEFYNFQKIEFVLSKGELYAHISDTMHTLAYKPIADITDPKTGDVLIKAGRKVTKGGLKKCRAAGIEKFQIDSEQVIGEFIAQDIINEETGEVLLDVNSPITEELLETIMELKLSEFNVLAIDDQQKDTSFRDTLAVDGVDNDAEALREIYKRMRPGDPPTPESVKTFFQNLFFNEKRYDLSEVGRKKINEKLELDIPPDARTLTKEDIFATVKYLFKLRAGTGLRDDIDHLGNRRVRSVGEQVAAQFRVGMVRMEKTILERMNIMDLETTMPHDLINSKPITAAIKEFFASSQLSQFMDETNPLSGLTHKRRLSSLGPGGLVRERAGFEVRDVHPTHYGRVCPVETPEGPNIGLISSLSTYARVNRYGFIETPYRAVENRKVSERVDYLTAAEEYKFRIAQANAPLLEDFTFRNPTVIARFGGEFSSTPAEEIEYMDVSPAQVFSVAASLIPFLEHDDANRALMGSNMQRQAVPPIKTEAPLVGTGMEKIAAKYAGTLVTARADGTVINVDAKRIVVRRDDLGQKTNGAPPKVDIYQMTKFGRSNQNTCINQKPLVISGQTVRKDDVLADGQATDRGELALGKNVLVGFMPWHGYNFEDAIILSEALIKRDVFTSIHVEEFEIDTRDTKYGKEEITNDIPGLSEEALRNVDESGIVRIGADVHAGDILVCKLTPKGETLLSPEEKLLKAIFGEKAGNVMDTSFRVPPGVNGTVVDVRVFTRSGTTKDERTIAIEEEVKRTIETNYQEEIRIIKLDKDERIRALLSGNKTAKAILATDSKEEVCGENEILTVENLAMVEGKDLIKIQVSDGDAREKLQKIEESANEHIRDLKAEMNEQLAKVDSGDELAPGVIKLIKVYVAIKRKMQVGDKMAGRHGNKGVVSVIVPEEDMPKLEDGTPLEILLNPLGVPSRMNVGQLMETSLGMAAKHLGAHFETPVFDGASEEDIKSLLRESGQPENCMKSVIDGRTGQKLSQKVFVGYIYMMKLHHLVEDKMHARSTGPYSLVTQQPLGGKAQFGGQRLGEMEVWALEAYGAAYSLQEMLTVKSDDVEGRKRMYEAIVKGDNTLQPGLPESFNVLVKELQALCLDISLDETDKKAL
jgi:DNA-directed RNA polymerase subunit beta